ncbi:spore protein [Bacillus manliponensis]|uniref:Spore protein n=1 Tax=Bacillus manliponensis TaxID=574376 RepID=A0A073JYF0_9BACI|nr:GerW family sporulation protein [Bacillus manliponensis]KEK20039.1 spore protein [Bacillus manliponensis]
MEHPIQGLMKAAMENLKEMVDVNTIVGEPVPTADGGVVLTVSKVAFGFGAGGSDFEVSNSQQSNGNPAFGGGSAGGVSITPVAFLVVNKDGVNILHLQNATHLAEKIIEMAPQTIDKIQSMFQKNNQQSGQQNNQQSSNYSPQTPDDIM